MDYRSLFHNKCHDEHLRKLRKAINCVDRTLVYRTYLKHLKEVESPPANKMKKIDNVLTRKSTHWEFYFFLA